MRRTAKQRLEAIEDAIAARNRFLERVKSAATRDEAVALIVEAVDMHLAANGLEVVGHDGRARVSMEDIAASHCLKAAREAYAAFVNT